MDELRAFADTWLAEPWVQALLLILGALVAAWIVEQVVARVLTRLAKRTQTQVDDEAIQALRRPVKLTVVVVGLVMAVRVLQLPPPLSRGVLGILGTLAIFVWSGALLRVSSIVLEGWSRLADRVTWIESRTLPLFDNLAKLVIAGGALYAILEVWNLNVGPWLASAGIVGIAVGFAAKDSLANLFGGLFVIADAPYKLDDFIVLDTGERGRVTKIGLRSTRLLTRDDVEITLPNAQIANAKIVNESGGPWEKQRVTLTVGVAYGSDVDQVRAALEECGAEVEHVVDDPPPRVRFTAFGDSALVFRLQCWIDEPAQRGVCMDALHTAVYKRFNRDGILIPFPQQDVYIKEMPRS
jgi:small-conductance mechanosensitive channel